MPELQRPGEEIFRDTNKRHEHQNGLMATTVTLSCLVGIARDYNPESVEAEKWGWMPLKADLAAPSVFEVRALLCPSGQTPWLGGTVNMGTCSLTWQNAGRSASLEPPCSTTADGKEQCFVGVYSGNYTVVQGGQRLLGQLLRAGGDFLGVGVCRVGDAFLTRVRLHGCKH